MFRLGSFFTAWLGHAARAPNKGVTRVAEPSPGLALSSASACAAALPSISVVVRSYKRHDSLLKIVQALRQQDYPNFEVVIMEQSGFTPEQREPLDRAMREDPRVRVLYSEPLGVGGAREAGWRAARNEIVLTIDDDDLLLGTDFVAKHAHNYLDPTIVAVTGRHVYCPDEVCGYQSRRRARAKCLRYNFFGYPHTFCRFDERIESVDWVHGTNGSVRRSVIERVGGWDARSTEHDEHPFCLALQSRLEPGERLVFDPSILLLRRKDIPGGAAVRFDGPRRIFSSWIRYYHDLVIPNRPLRSTLLYPIFPLASTFGVVYWIWKDSLVHRGFWQRLGASAHALVKSPLWYVQELARVVRLGDSRIKKRPTMCREPSDQLTD
jgi:glycosyltransferase involved in cell wall biosynthesis